MQGKLTQNISSLTKLFSCQGCFCKYYLAAIYDNFRETIPRQKLSNQFSLIIKHMYWATNENKVIFNPRCFLFHFWSITRSSVVCNFTNEWKLLVSRGGSRFSFCYIVIGGDKPWVWRVWVYPCRPHLFADKVITDVTAYVCIKCVSGFKVGWEYNVQEKIKEILNSRLFKVIYDLTYGN